MNRVPESYQYLPLFAKVAIDRIDSDSSLRTTEQLDSMLDAYAKTYGTECDDYIRFSAQHIAARRFWNFNNIHA